ncbi:DUF3349 domain-containing protein [Phycicoccus endophyticus]|uniref:DUF3349 domain-containing protein n=1 Tax=Phycicoccus endophyticus TaxID=1690220 RepID=UPI00197C016C|nr:DUF3349 domain-containing protein [Phycicoccus endophyticus]GGL33961.1 hypothetical protein GCM10012283_15510 [Phycicoccus endophyticus]
MAAHRGFVRRSLDWLRAGYPAGIPLTDYPAVVGVLHRHLTAAEVDSVAAELAAHARAGEPVTEADVRRIIEERAYESAGADDVRRVSAALAAGGWPLAGRTPDEDELEGFEPPGEGSVLARIVAWLREGYPEGIPTTDYVPLIALLRRRLTDKEVKQVARSLRQADVAPATSVDIGEFISKVTQDMPSEDDVRRVRAQLAKKGWPVEFPDPDLP